MANANSNDNNEVHQNPPADSPLRHVERLVRLERRGQLNAKMSDRVADRIAHFAGSMTFAAVHAIWFGGWIVYNSGWLNTTPFDPFPFGILTMIGSLEAIFLSTFVLISQNRQALQADRRAKVDLQINLIAEEEITKLIGMVQRVQTHLGLPETDDPITHEMGQPTPIEQIAEALDEASELLDS